MPSVRGSKRAPSANSSASETATPAISDQKNTKKNEHGPRQREHANPHDPKEVVQLAVARDSWYFKPLATLDALSTKLRTEELEVRTAGRSTAGQPVPGVGLN